MLPQHKLDRINELSKKSKTSGLSQAEATEQQELRQEYLKVFRSTIRDTIEHVKVIDPNGDDVTPKKVVESQKKNRLQ